MTDLVRARNNEFVREHLRSCKIDSRGEKQGRGCRNDCLGLSPAGGMTINEDAGVRCYSKRNQGAGKQEQIVAREFRCATKGADGKRRPKPKG